MNRRARAATDPSPAGQEPHAADDAELMDAVVAGNISALGALYDRYHEEVRRFALRMTARDADADDIVHDVFLSLPKAGSGYDGRACARPFLIAIARQMVCHRARKRARIARMIATLSETLIRVVRRTPEDDVNAAHELAAVARVVERLPEEKRMVLLMIEREGLSCEEVAAELGIPVGTVWTRLHYARAELRRVLAKRRSG
jgi:RNA polymerase sigma-70 factor (ECF subfamily)